MDPFITISRRLLDWEWFDDEYMVKMWLYLLLKANWEDKTWKGVVVKRGQLISSVSKIATGLGFSVQKTRTCLNNMQKTKEIDIQSTNKYSIITICKYDEYQTKDFAEQQTNNKQTNKQRQTPTTTTKQLNNNIEENTTPKGGSVKEEFAASAAALLETHQKFFYDSLIPFVGTYPKEMLREFYEYWSEPNRSQTKMRCELERTWDIKRRLKTWASKEPVNKQNNGNNRTSNQSTAESRMQAAASIVERLAAKHGEI